MILAMKYSSLIYHNTVAARFRVWKTIRQIGNRNSSTAVPIVGKICEEIFALCHDGCLKEAVETLHRLEHRGLRAGSKIYASLLRGCADMKLLDEGMKVHDHITKCGFEPDIFVSNNLVTMYAKCGNLKFAREVFDKMLQRDSVSWTALISGYAQHSYGADALKLFIQMQRESVAPDKFTWVVVLKACACLADLETGRICPRREWGGGFQTLLSNAVDRNEARCLHIC